MNPYLIRGASSLLFLIPAINSYYYSKLVFWKLFITVLVPVSFLCNATVYKDEYLILDYISIFLISLSYINHRKTNILFIFALCAEYNYKNSIETTKNVAFVSAIAKANVVMFPINKPYFYILISSSVSALVVYKARHYLFANDIKQYNTILTYLFHVCMSNVLYMSSITAV